MPGGNERGITPLKYKAYLRNAIGEWGVITPYLFKEEFTLLAPLLALAHRRGKSSGLAMTGVVSAPDQHGCFS